MIVSLLLACAPSPEPVEPLPDRLAAVVALARGGYASVVIDLDRAHASPRVRIAPELLLVGQGWVRAVTLEPSGTSATSIPTIKLLDGLRSGAPLIEASIDPNAAVVAVDQREIWIRSGDETQRIDGTGPRAHLPASAPVLPGGELHRDGPGNGFHVRLREQRLELQRPRGEPSSWRPVLRGVDALLGAWWIHSASLPEDELALLDERFKQVGLLLADEGDANLDGSLDEWQDASALPVDQRSQVQSGAEWWSGARDGAFGVAARTDGQRLLLALRVRDDHWIEGDRLEIALGDRLIRVPLGSGADHQEGLSWSSFRNPLQSAEIGVEVAMSMPGSGGRPRAVAWLVDADPGQGDTRLGTAPDAFTAELAAITARDADEAARP